MRGPQVLLDHEDRWSTRMGGWFPGKRVVFRGKDLFHELNEFSWLGLLLYGITGRVFDEKQVRLFEGIWVLCTSYPEPRIWNNRIASLAGTARSTTNLGASAAMAVTEAIIYGHRPTIAAMGFLLYIQGHLDLGVELDQLLAEEFGQTETSKHGHSGWGANRRVAKIPGYGRPVTHEDERIRPLMQLAEELGYLDRCFVRLTFRIERALLQSGRPLYMNISALMAGLAADQGLTPRQFYHYMISCCNAGIIPCAIDAFKQPPGAFFPLRCERIQYEGESRRIWRNQNGGDSKS